MERAIKLVRSGAMKICIIAPYNVLSLSSGASSRVFGIAKGLSTHGASVFVLHHGPPISFSFNFKFIKFKSFSPLLDSSNYFHPLNPFYSLQLSRLLKKYDPDVVQGEQPWSAFPTVLFTKRFGIPYMLDEHNVEVLWSVYASRTPFLTPYTFIIEKFAISNSSLILTASDIDKKQLLRIYKISKEKLFVIPNGVDLSRFSNMPSSSTLKNKLGFNPKSKIVVFHGLLSARQNYEAVKLIIEYIAPKVKDAKFLIIGKSSQPWLKVRSETQKNTLILGHVPKIEEYIMAADVCIVPLRSGSGTRLKVIEYLAAGKPLVTTAKGCQGIGLQREVHAKVCEEVNDCFIDSLKELLSDEKLANEMGSAAMEYAKRFDWKRVTKGITDIYSKILDEKL